MVTARASYSRIRTALEAIRDHPGLALQVVAGASAVLERYGNVAAIIERDGFAITARVHMMLEGENLMAMAKTTGIGLMELATVFDNLQPDIVVTVADRYETLATAVAAAYMNIPLVHIQGGEVTGSIDEKVRHAVTKLADYHFVSTEQAAERVRRMGECPDRVFVTGCPSIDLAAKVIAGTSLDFNPFIRYGGVGADLDISNGYIVVLQHPVTTEYHRARRDVWETLSAVSRIGLPTLWFWPNSDAGADGTSNGIRAFREIEKPANIHFFKNIGSEDFLRVLLHCRCLVGNTSAGIREGSFLGVPFVNIGSRQAGRDRGANVIDASYESDQIIAAIETQLTCSRFPGETIYGSGDAGRKIADLIASVPLTVDKRLNY